MSRAECHRYVAQLPVTTKSKLTSLRALKEIRYERCGLDKLLTTLRNALTWQWRGEHIMSSKIGLKLAKDGHLDH